MPFLYNITMPERQVAYQSIENKKHLGFIVTAPSWQRLYVDSALAMTDKMVSLDLILERDKKTITVTEANPKALMISLLNAVLELFEKDQFLAKRIVFNEFDGKKITAILFGEKYVAVRHGYRTDLKSSNEKAVEMGDSPTEPNQFYAKVTIHHLD